MDHDSRPRGSAGIKAGFGVTDRRLHQLTVFGATGISAKATLAELLHGPSARWPAGFTWAIAGRNRVALEHLRASLFRTGEDGAAISHIVPPPDIIVADVHDERSLTAMSRKTKLLLNCVGPYSEYGEPVVKACLETCTDYLDLSGEPGFIERMHLLYHDAAVKANITIVHAAAFDSVPCDLGVLCCKKLLAERGAYPSSVEMFLSLKVSMTHAINYTTYESAINGFSSVKALHEDRKKLACVRPVPVPFGPPVNHTAGLNGVIRDPRVRGWLVPFFFSDPAVVRLSQSISSHMMKPMETPPANLAPVHFAAYIHVETLQTLLRYLLHFPLFQYLAVRPWGRNLLYEHPDLFSGGLISKEKTPVETPQDNIIFTQTYYAKGYSSAVSPSPSNTPDVTIAIRITGTEMTYRSTALIFLEVASLVLRRPDAVRKGVLTPAVAFGHLDTFKRTTSPGEGGVIDALQRDGRITWSILEDTKPKVLRSRL